MKLEVGKTYKLNNGQVHKCTRMMGVDPLDVDLSGYGPFVIRGMCYHMNGVFANGKSEDYNVASCVDDTPTLWRDMTPEEKGALLLADFNGETIQVSGEGGVWYDEYPEWDNGEAYRIKPEPKVETVTAYARIALGGDFEVRSYYCDHWEWRITFNTIDGKPDTASIKMEVL